MKTVTFYVEKISKPVPLTGLLIAHGNCGGGAVNVNEGVVIPSLVCSVCGYTIGLTRPDEELVHTALTGEAVEENRYDRNGRPWTLCFELMTEEVRAKLIPQGLSALRRAHELKMENERLNERIGLLERANDHRRGEITRLRKMLWDLETAGHRFADAVYATRRTFQSAELARAREAFLHKMEWLGLT